MSSWFSGLKDLSKDLSEKVQAALPKIDSETLQKLTLNTPELQAERAALQQEYHHKVAVKDSLAHMYPWETRDAERDILVEECKDAIMALSLSVDTFFGPYPMPLLNVNTDDDDDKDKEKNEDDDDDEHEHEDQDGNANSEDEHNATGTATDTATNAKKLVKDMEPSMESLEKLSKLEPLPPLLADFDLLAHVGLIQKMLKVDRNLVERQSTLSGKLFLCGRCVFCTSALLISMYTMFSECSTSSVTITQYWMDYGWSIALLWKVATVTIIHNCLAWLYCAFVSLFFANNEFFYHNTYLMCFC